MQLAFRFTLIFIVLISSWARAQAEPIRNIVYDLDWTAVYQLGTPEKAAQTLAQMTPEERKLVYFVDGEFYRLSDDWIESVMVLAAQKNVELYVYSGGKAERNLNLLRQIKLPNGQPLVSLFKRILSYEDLVQVSTDTTLRFAQRYKKDLRKISSDLTNTVIIDDHNDFVLNDATTNQKDNVLWLQNTYDFELKPKAQTKILERQKLQYALGILLTALQQPSGAGLAFDIAELTHHNKRNRESPSAAQFYDRGRLGIKALALQVSGANTNGQKIGQIIGNCEAQLTTSTSTSTKSRQAERKAN